LISIFIELSFYQENQKQLLAKLPHEIRASLTNIGSICEYIKLRLQKDKYSKARRIFGKLKDIEEECHLSQMTLNSLHVFEDTIEEYEFTQVNIFTDIIAKTRKMLNPMASARRYLSIRYENLAEFPEMYLDKYRMQIVFHNLLLNAIKYSHKNFARERDKDILISSAVNNKGELYSISISNYGIGIPKNKERDIFINGYRTFEAIKVDPGGRGFGLALVKNILKFHGIDIRVTQNSDPTTFTLYFPNKLQNEIPTFEGSEEETWY
jgi:signal transduction histidine kinase